MLGSHNKNFRVWTWLPIGLRILIKIHSSVTLLQFLITCGLLKMEWKCRLSDLIHIYLNIFFPRSLESAGYLNIKRANWFIFIWDIEYGFPAVGFCFCYSSNYCKQSHWWIWLNSPKSLQFHQTFTGWISVLQVI